VAPPVKTTPPPPSRHTVRQATTARAEHRVARRETAGTARPPATGSAAAVVAAALAMVGTPYRFGAAGRGGVDCSGLALLAYAAVGIHLPHSTGRQLGAGVSVTRGAMMPGDLVFPSAGHVGIYLGGGMMVAAPKPGDHVKVQAVYAFYTARRLL
jgi:peptidoglycan DL-endopeptidase CwlO